MGRRFKNDDSGLTLIEVVITVGLLGVVLGPVSISMLFGLAHSSGTRDRIADSSSAQIASSYLPGDIQSADTLQLSGGSCPASPEASDTVRLRLAWDRPKQGTAVDTTVAYFTRPGPDGTMQLHRAKCTTGEAESQTLVVQHLSGSSGFDVQCDAAPCPVGPATPREVTVTLRMFNAQSASEIYDESEHEFTVTRRTEP